MPFTDTKQRKNAFFHSLSKVLESNGQNPYESSTKSSHTITAVDVLSEEVPYAADGVAADANVLAYPSRLVKYTQLPLEQIPGSNGQAWRLRVSGSVVRPFLDPVDIINSTGTPSFGYQVKLYTGAGTQIFPTQGAWEVSSYAGVIQFEAGFTPADMGWGTPKITCYVYIGKNLEEALAGIVGGTTYQEPVSSKVEFDPSTLTPSDDDRYIVGGENYPIIATDIALDTFTIAGDHTTLFAAGEQFKVIDSSNDGLYTVDSVVFDTTNTVITVVEDITEAVVLQGNAQIAYGVWNGYNDYVATYKSGTWTYSLPEKGWVTFLLDTGVLNNYNGVKWVDIGSTSNASDIATNTSSFNYFLNTSHTNIQLALNRLDKVLYEGHRVFRETADFTPTEYGIYIVDTTGGDVTITMPVIADVTDAYVYMEFINTGANNIIFTSTQNINGSASDITVGTNYEKVSMVSEWDGSAGEWFYTRTKQIDEIFNAEVYDNLTLTAGTTTYTLSGTPIIPGKSKVYLNGVKLSYTSSEYSFSGSDIVLDETNLDLTLETGMELEVYYY